MIRNFLSVVALLLISLNSYSQTLYDFQWDYDGLEYSGLMIFYNENDIHMRIGFEEDGGYNVSESEYIYSPDEEYGEFVFLEEVSTEYIQDEAGETNEIFHFFWVLDEYGEMEGPFAISDYDLENDLIDELVEVSLEELNHTDINSDYLLQYYLPEEEEYALLISAEQQEEYIPPTNVETVNLHLVIVANTKISDIGASTKVDADNLTGELSGIAEVLKMNFKKTVISGVDFTKTKLENALTALNPQPNDMVVFYYSGHGFRYSGEQVKYPQLDMRYNAYQEMGEGTTVNLEDIYDVITKKGGRLNIILGDCCNNDIGTTRQVGTNFMASRGNVNADVEKLKKLFLNSSGNLIAAGASKGEYSWCSSQGGFFTNSFISALREESSALRANDVANWADIISKTKTSTLSKSNLCKECDVQNVVFEKSIKD
ncbi:MAG: hypothetical protein ACI837_000699 [Crocinitomicaceae bacterium]|jgi:hypothetical protein